MTTEIAHPFTHLGRPPYRFTGWTRRVYQACHGAPIQPGSSCDHCGTAIMYEFWVRSADDRHFKVGCDCILKLNGVDPELEAAARAERRKIRRETNRLRNEAKRAERARLRLRRGAEQAREFLAAFPDVADLFRGRRHPVLRDMAGKLARYGSLSEAQIRYARSIVARADAPPEVFDGKFPADGERVDVEGRILTVKAVRGPVPWESSYKMLVALKDADGREYKAWGTYPRALDDAGADRGDRIAFRAAFTRAKDDPHFGFFNRPAKARLLEKKEDE